MYLPPGSFGSHFIYFPCFQALRHPLMRFRSNRSATSNISASSIAFPPRGCTRPTQDASYHHTRHDHPPHLFRNTKNIPKDLHNPFTETASLLLCAPPTRSPPSGVKQNTGCTQPRPRPSAGSSSSDFCVFDDG
jgi:hypothetical protein